MHEVRHYAFLLGGLLLLGLLVGLVPTLWVAGVTVVSIGVNRLTRVIALMDRGDTRRLTLPLLAVCSVLSLVLAAGGALLLFLRFGWLPALGCVVLFIGYFAAKEDDLAKARRIVSKTRLALRESIVGWADGRITEEQLQRRTTLILRQGLPREAYFSDSIYNALMSTDGLSPDQHRRLLELMERHLAEAEGQYPRSKLHKAVRTSLGLS